jgi:hypothetical protein
MRAKLYLKEIKPDNLLALVENLEVVPRGLYEIDGRTYQYSGTPKFIIQSGRFRGECHNLVLVELVLEEYIETIAEDCCATV